MRMQRGRGGRAMRLYPLAGLASINIFPDIMLNLRSPIIVSDKLCSFVATRVSSKGRIVVFTDNVLSELGVNGNINAFSKGDQSIFQLLPAFFFITQCSFHSFFMILRMLTDQGLKFDRF